MSESDAPPTKALKAERERIDAALAEIDRKLRRKQMPLWQIALCVALIDAAALVAGATLGAWLTL